VKNQPKKIQRLDNNGEVRGKRRDARLRSFVKQIVSNCICSRVQRSFLLIILLYYDNIAFRCTEASISVLQKHVVQQLIQWQLRQMMSQGRHMKSNDYK
jgi:hypothetical protein